MIVYGSSGVPVPALTWLSGLPLSSVGTVYDSYRHEKMLKFYGFSSGSAPGTRPGRRWW